MSKIDYAYFAGFIDGEGTVTLTKNGRNENRSPVLCVTNTDRDILEQLRLAFGGSISIAKRYEEHHLQAYHWKVVGNACIATLQILVPYLRHKDKVRRARLIIDRYKEVTPRNGKYTDEMKLAKKGFEEEFFSSPNP